MAISAVGDDIFSILNAFSPKRWGENDLTAPGAQPQPQPKPIQMAQAGGATASDASGGGGDGPVGPIVPKDFVPPKPDVSRRIEPNTAPKVEVSRPSGYAGGPVSKDPVTASPSGLADGGIDVFKLWQEQQEKQRKMQLATQIGSGAQLMLAGLTRSPSMREVLSAASRDDGISAGGGAGGGGAGGGMTFANLLDLQKLGQSNAERKAMLGRLPALSKQTGMSPERLEAIYLADKAKFAELIVETTKDDNVAKENKDGSLTIYSRRNPEQTLRRIENSADPDKVAAIAEEKAEADRKAGLYPGQLRAQTDTSQAAADAHSLVPGQLRAQGDTHDAAVDTRSLVPGQLQAQQDAQRLAEDAHRLAPETLAKLKQDIKFAQTEQAYKDEKHPLEVRQMHEDLLNKYKTGDEKDYLAMNAELAKKGVEPRFKTYEEYKMYIERTRSPGADNTARGFIFKDMSEQREKTKINLGQGLDTLEEMQRKIHDPAGIYAGSKFEVAKGEALREVGAVLGIKADPKTTNTQIYTDLVQEATASVVKQFGSNASNPDADRAEKAVGGKLDMNDPESLKFILRFRAQSALWQADRMNKEAEKQAKLSTGDDKNAYERFKVDLPSPERMARLSSIPKQALADLRADPSPESRREFNEKFGKMAGLLLDGRVGDDE